MNFESLKHPCFSIDACAKFARLHLPVAPKCNIMCNYCRRRFDCVNESRPGVTSTVLSPKEALERFVKAKKLLPLSVVGIAGPGDPLANPDEVFETLRLVREIDKDIIFCLSTNGLMLPDYAGKLAEAGVSHITVTVNAIKPETARRIYRFVEYGGQRILGKDASKILLERQLEGIKLAVAGGAMVKVNVVYIKGLNESEIPAIAEEAREAGACLCNIMQLIPVKGTLFEDLPLTSREEINELRNKCEEILPQMRHCRQCRADAAGLLGDDKTIELFGRGVGINNQICPQERAKSEIKNSYGAGKESSGTEKPRKTRFYAAASRNGLIVDEHFGHVEELFIYKYEEDGEGGDKVSLVEKRKIPQYCKADDQGDESCGSRTDRIHRVAQVIEDCEALFVLRIGEVPRFALSQLGIKVVLSYDYVENAIKELERQTGDYK